MKNFINSIVSAFDPVGANGAQFAALCVGETIGDHFYLKYNGQKKKDKTKDRVSRTQLKLGAEG
jgi:hypothetical protein